MPEIRVEDVLLVGSKREDLRWSRKNVDARNVRGTFYIDQTQRRRLGDQRHFHLSLGGLRIKRSQLAPAPECTPIVDCVHFDHALIDDIVGGL
jgi:hypothetical protein